MNDQLRHLSTTARAAVQDNNWPVVQRCAEEILKLSENSPEGNFLGGLAAKAANQPVRACAAFEQVLAEDGNRYDAAVELANQYSIARRNGEAAALIDRYLPMLDNSPRYLDMAGTVFSSIGLPGKALPLYRKAHALQPEIDLFQANLAAAAVYMGSIEEGRDLYRDLLDRFPNHQRNHYQLARLAKAKDDSHVQEMKKLLHNSSQPPERNVFLYYALAKELEDLERWDEAFSFYQQAGDAVTSVARYNVASDIRIIDSVMATCTAEWLGAANKRPSKGAPVGRTPLFVVGLPRTGTTLTERILSSHSQVGSLGETQFLQMVLRRESGVHTKEKVSAEIIEAVASADPQLLADGYMQAVDYRLDDKPLFIEKLPYNFLFLGFVAKAWPDARIVLVDRHPMDACFSMYKQVFTWAYRFSYSQEQLGQYYVAYDRLAKHWQDVLGERLVRVRYETLVAEQEPETRRLLGELGLDFEQACLDFDQNTSASTTASSVQVRQKIHSGSIGRWQRFERQLQPLHRHLQQAGIDLG